MNNSLLLFVMDPLTAKSTKRKQRDSDPGQQQDNGEESSKRHKECTSDHVTTHFNGDSSSPLKQAKQSQSLETKPSALTNDPVVDKATALILRIFAFLLDPDEFFNLMLVCKRWRELTNSKALCGSMPNTLADGSLNRLNFRKLAFKGKGTEGLCFKCAQRSTGKVLAMKKAKVFPEGEGVPYYMLRELGVLKQLSHDNISPLLFTSLTRDELHLFFPFVDKTLHDLIEPNGPPQNSDGDYVPGRILPGPVMRRFMYQLLDALAYCHRKGVLHRNLKPKHLLIKTSDPEALDDAVLHISDLALVRAIGYPRRTYTTEVVTLWYRAPEILMGIAGYSSAVDVWSAGCIFAEMAQGKSLFTGISEIDQLFQIFSTLSTPTEESWPGFKELPNYGFEFPKWKRRPLKRLFPDLCEEAIDLLDKLLTYNPDQRISAEDALGHPYFSEKVPASPRKAIEYDPAERDAKQIEQFHSYLRTKEQATFKQIKYLSWQNSINSDHRSILVDWIIEVVDSFNMCIRTAFLAANYIDRFLDLVQVKKTRFQLLGAACLHIASKYEDLSYIGVEDLVTCGDNAYTSVDVLRMEERILRALDFHLAMPTSMDFLSVYETLMPSVPKKTSMVAHYLLELALQEYQFLKFLPSVVASCCLAMALFVSEGTAKTNDLAKVCHYKWSDVCKCMEELQELYTNLPSTGLETIKKRYSSAERCEVVSMAKPKKFAMAQFFEP